jgi:tRNA-splicing ligase RtcB
MTNIREVAENIYEIPREGEMRVPGRLYLDEALLDHVRHEASLQQVANVATLPGIVGYSFAMPDIHQGYGFSIGGVAAMDAEDGVVSPGGVGYDINCGVRLARTSLDYPSIKDRLPEIVASLYAMIPTGIGSHGAIPRLSRGDLQMVLAQGAGWAVKKGYGTNADLEFTEERGAFRDADPEGVSKRANERGSDQLGTLGSGNHFVELAVVEEIYHPEAAQAYGLFEGQVTVMIHSGSRGLGYQVCDDYLRVLGEAMRRYGIHLPDRQLACVPLGSPEGQRYLGAMRASANFAWANRQILMALAQRALERSAGVSPKQLGFGLVYDLAHNIVKFEEHEFEGEKRKVAVHRKGATRAFGPGRHELPERYRAVGQPVLLPGDMGRASYLLVGTEKAMQETFGSSAHGAGRQMSRSQALREASKRNILAEMKERHVEVMAANKKTIAEEMPEAYKDVSAVAEVMHRTGISLKVARFRPVGVIKG